MWNGWLKEKTSVTIGNGFVSPWLLPIPLADTRQTIQTSSILYFMAAVVRVGADATSHHGPYILVLKLRPQDPGGNSGSPRPPLCSSCPCVLLAFQLASGLGAFRYPELIKVFDRFQLEYEFLPETSTIRFPKHDA